MKDVLFICKKSESYSVTGRRSGLYNSTRFVVDGLRAAGLTAHVVEVVDNNDIDREVTQYKPDLVVIEALWVVPSKFDVLMKLHPNVRWALHLHSNMPFLAGEGIAVEWIKECHAKGIQIITNSDHAYEGVSVMVHGQKGVHRLHNMYLGQVYKPKPIGPKKEEINIGCFGAIRPMKNHLTQALAAQRFADRHSKRLNFHINATRSEGGDGVLKNLRAAFARTPYKLVEVPWLPHDQFVEYIRSNIDLGLQVSMSETFNIVAADMVSAGVPIVTSKEVDWVDSRCWANPASVNDIEQKMSDMAHSWWYTGLTNVNQRNLKTYTQRASKEWTQFLQGKDVTP